MRDFVNIYTFVPVAMGVAFFVWVLWLVLT